MDSLASYSKYKPTESSDKQEGEPDDEIEVSDEKETKPLYVCRAMKRGQRDAFLKQQAKREHKARGQHKGAKACVLQLTNLAASLSSHGT